ncbi:hypothetical protein BH09BAC5_BH09BAC5_21290 [soil metagenome]
MKYLILVTIFISSFLISCQSAEEKAAEKAKQDSLAACVVHDRFLHLVDSSETVMKADKNYDQRNAMGTLKAYNDFVQKYPTDTMTDEYLFRASDLAQGAKQYTQAAEYLETILANHKDYRKYRIACFTAAYIYDSYLEEVNHGDDRAKQLYQFVIDNYPNTSEAEQSKILITKVGIPDDVWIQEIIKKGGK